MAHEGEKVPIQVNIRFSRSNIANDEEFFGNVTENDSKNMKKVALSESEKDAFVEIIRIHRDVLEEYSYGFGWKP